MNPVIYQLSGVLPEDKYVPGQYQWSIPVQLSTALLDCQPPSTGTLTIILEVGGVLKSFRFTVAAGTSPLAIPQSVNVLVPANTAVRWKASFAGAPEDAAVELSITLQPVEQSISQVAAVRPQLTVQWANGKERLTLFNYNPDTHSFTETSTGISAGRAVIVQAGDASLSIYIGTPPMGKVFQALSSAIWANSFIAIGGTASGQSPRLSFMVGNATIATLAADALRIPNLIEDMSPALTPTDAGYYCRFEFYSGGILTGVLNASGLTALGLEELP